MGVANSLALKEMQVSAETENPEGGMIGRLPNSNEPNGLVQETAMYPFVGHMLQVLNSKQAEFFDQTPRLLCCKRYHHSTRWYDR